MFLNILAASAFLAGIGSLSVLSAHTAVYFMVLCFLLTGIVYYLMASTYLAMMLFIVYVGAIAILFVFCVILLDFNVRYLASRAFSLSFFIISVATLFIIFVTFGADFFVVYPRFIVLSGFSVLPEFAESTKDSLFLSAFTTFYIPYYILIGLVLFFVTVAVTVLLG